IAHPALPLRFGEIAGRVVVVVDQPPQGEDRARGLAEYLELAGPEAPAGVPLRRGGTGGRGGGEAAAGGGGGAAGQGDEPRDVPGRRPRLVALGVVEDDEVPALGWMAGSAEQPRPGQDTVAADHARVADLHALAGASEPDVLPAVGTDAAVDGGR